MYPCQTALASESLPLRATSQNSPPHSCASSPFGTTFRSRCYAEGLSKAIVTGYVGAKDGLASERTYIFQTLPNGLMQGIIDEIFLRFDLTGILRAGAIVAGLMVTTVGYLVDSFSQHLSSRKGTNAKNHRPF